MAKVTRIRKQRPARPAFTLIELLVVIAILAVLASLSVAAVMKVLNSQQKRNTQTLISKLDDGLNKQWRSVVETAKMETPNAWAVALSGGNADLAQVIHIKCRLRQEFPTSFAEALNPLPLPPKPSYVRALQNAQAGARTWQAESSACLYLALKEKRRSGDFNPDTSLSAQEVIDPVGDGIKEIHDGWGNPIVFSRFPTAPSGIVNTVNPSGPQGVPPSHDPVDPDSLLTNPAWVTSPLGASTLGAQYQLYMHPVFANANYKLIPVIMSMGTDGQIYDPAAPVGQNDDIYNIQLTPLNQQ
jgi:prepilin-type N-terminal cleavage/methylation domain-containing protein